MTRMMAYCGLDCSQCPAYIATQKNDMGDLAKVAEEWSKGDLRFTKEDIMCDGCRSDEKIFSWCKECEIRSCNREKELQNCGYCVSFPCELLNNVFNNDPRAKSRLDEVHNKIS